VGDLDPEHVGNEIVAVSITGEVHLVRRQGKSWQAEVIAKAGGELIQCAVGDVDPRAPGNEIVAVGMVSGTEDDGGPGAAYVVSRTGEGWRIAPVFTDDALLHGVCVGDLDRERPGREILAVGFSGRATLVFAEGEAWSGETVADLEGAGKNAVLFREGAAVATGAGKILHVRKSEGGWETEVFDEAEVGQARLGTDGTRLLAARDDGALGLWANGDRADIHKEGKKLRGAVLADLDPDSPGVEAACVGYEMRMTVLFAEEGGWRAKTVFTDTARFHHLASGELLVEGRGRELVGCGYSKRLVVVGLR
jgi:hypothetical protein